MSTDQIELSGGTRETLERHNLRPLREIAEEDLGQARENLSADSWAWADVRTAMDQVAEDVPPDSGPRVTVPVNSAYESAVSHTISVGVESAPPGHTTPAHRHSGHFLRFAIDGRPEMRTAVAGEEFPMLENDLVTIPQWAWHGHVNGSEKEATWLVIDDSPLRLDALNIGNLYEPHDDDRQPISREAGYHASQYSACRPPSTNGAVPEPFEGTRDTTPAYRFPWADMSETLDHAEGNEDAHSPYDGVVASYTNPARGAPPLFPTFGVRAQRLPDGEATDTHTHNATEVYYVVAGSGQTIADDEPIDWDERDIFVVPTYTAHSHNPDGEATLLTVSDRPLLEALNSYHEFEGD